MYATVADLIARYGEDELTRLTAAPDADPYVVDEAKAAVALADASATIDSYLRPRYRLPLAIVPEILRRDTCALARYELHHGSDRTPTDQVKAARDEVMAWLRDVAAGRAQLDLDAAGADEPEAPGPRFQSARREFAGRGIR